MSATPGAKNEYSRGSGLSGRDSGGNFGGSGPPSRRRTDELDGGTTGLILAGALLGALLLIVAEFTALYKVHLATSSVPIKTVSGGSNNSYAMLLIGLAAAGLGIAVWRSGSRPALLALGILGLVALLIAVLGDLPDSHATGLGGSAAHGYVNASSTPSAGLYLETLGGILLIATSGLGFMLLGTPAPKGRRRSPGAGQRPESARGVRRGVNGGGSDGARDEASKPPDDPRQAPEAPQAWTRRKRSNPPGNADK